MQINDVNSVQKNKMCLSQECYLNVKIAIVLGSSYTTIKFVTKSFQSSNTFQQFFFVLKRIKSPVKYIQVNAQWGEAQCQKLWASPASTSELPHLADIQKLSAVGLLKLVG